MNAIVSVTRDWGIGKDGKLLVDNPADMRRFVELTCGGRSPKDAAPGEVLGTLVMGRRTLESFPGGKPLPARRNIVLSHASHFEAEGVEVVHDKPELSRALAQGESGGVWLVGGSSVYKYLVDNCRYAYVTFHDCIREADRWFPNLDHLSNWELESEEEGGITEEGIPFSYRVYRNLKLGGEQPA